jgi:transcriptional regulator with XRE-family HTH domain
MDNDANRKEALAKWIGARVREIRRSSGMTLKQVAQAAGLSAPLLSRIENGQVMPSVLTLQGIAMALNVEIEHLFSKGDEGRSCVSRAGTRRMIVTRRGAGGDPSYEVELLAEGMENPFMEPVIVTLRSTKGEGNVPLVTHEGQEFMYVLEGRMQLTLGATTHLLKRGDSAYWDGKIPHKGISLTAKRARTLNVHLVPGKRTGTFQ